MNAVRLCKADRGPQLFCFNVLTCVANPYSDDDASRFAHALDTPLGAESVERVTLCRIETPLLARYVERARFRPSTCNIRSQS
jgi:hypothetical protein